jgi:hypothetical protein
MSLNNRHLSLCLVLVCATFGACSAATQEPGGSTPEATGGKSGGTGGKTGGSGGGTSSTGGSGPAGSGGASGTAGSGGASGGGSGGAGEGSGGAAGGGSGGAAGGSGGAGGADAAEMPDVAGPGADMGPVTGPLPPAVRKVYVLHDANAGGSAGDPSRKSLVDILTSMKDSHGIVIAMANSPTKASEMMDAALIIVGPNSSMFGANHPDPGLKTVAIPLMVSKDGNTTEIGLGKVGATAPPNFNRITIVKTDHPLAAGLPMGNVVVLTTPAAQRIITFADVGPGAIKIATGPQSATSYSIIGYEKGADMGGGTMAPARRVGFFWHRPAAATPEGIKLFKAAVDWLLR